MTERRNRRAVTEHVCEIKQDYQDVPWESDDFSGTVERREEIVQCRDCGRAYRRGGGVYCSRVLQWGSNDRPAPLSVNPDGFCAWGQKEEES